MNNFATPHYFAGCQQPEIALPTNGRALLATLLIGLLLTLGSGLAAADDAAPEAAVMAAAETVNINTADAETLSRQLQGIGLTRAQEIIRYREAYGPFSSVEELVDVKGIGQATLDKNRVFITLE